MRLGDVPMGVAWALADTRPECRRTDHRFDAARPGIKMAIESA